MTLYHLVKAAAVIVAPSVKVDILYACRSACTNTHRHLHPHAHTHVRTTCTLVSTRAHMCMYAHTYMHARTHTGTVHRNGTSTHIQRITWHYYTDDVSKKRARDWLLRKFADHTYQSTILFLESLIILL